MADFINDYNSFNLYGRNYLNNSPPISSNPTVMSYGQSSYVQNNPYFNTQLQDNVSFGNNKPYAFAPTTVPPADKQSHKTLLLLGGAAVIVLGAIFHKDLSKFLGFGKNLAKETKDLGKVERSGSELVVDTPTKSRNASTVRTTVSAESSATTPKADLASQNSELPKSQPKEAVPSEIVEPKVSLWNESNLSISNEELQELLENINQNGTRIRLNSLNRELLLNNAKSKPEILSMLQKTEEIAKQMDGVFEKASPLRDEHTVYRGLTCNFLSGKHIEPLIKDAKVGEVIIPDPSFAYVAWNERLAKGYATELFFEIVMPKGSKVIHHGGESILPRNAKFKILAKDIVNNGCTRIKMQYIEP